MRAINLNFCQIWSNWVTPRKLSSGVTVWKFRGWQWHERPDCNLNLLCGYHYLGNGGDGIRTQIKATRCCSNARPRPSRKRVWISKIHKEDPPKISSFDVKMCICGKMHFLVYWKIALLSTHQVWSSFGNYYLAVNRVIFYCSYQAGSFYIFCKCMQPGLTKIYLLDTNLRN